jgi:hypothetical protein
LTQSTGCAGCIELREKVAELNNKMVDMQKEIDILKAKDGTLTLRETCLCLERFITFELFGADARRDERHQFGLLSPKDVATLDEFLNSHGMDRKLFKVLKQFGNNTAHVHRDPMSANELEAMIRDKNDYRKVADRKSNFLRALQKYKIIRTDGTLDIFLVPAFA